MHHPSLRRALALFSLASFTLFWVATIAEAWCPMHQGRVAAASLHAGHAPETPSEPLHCNCPGDCGGAAVASLVTPVAVVDVGVRTLDAPAARTHGTNAPGRPQLRLPFATAPPVA